MRPQDTFDAIVRGHRALRKFVQKALSDIETEALHSDLRELRGMLPVHFDFEERAGGFLERIRTGIPAGEAEVDLLRAEHDAFRVDIEEIIADLGGDQAELRGRIRDFATRLRDHEQKERTWGSQITLWR